MLRLIRSAGGAGAAEALCLAAAPTFAIMALLSAALGGGAEDVICGAGAGHSALGGMTAMYALMSVFHAAPWFQRVRRRQGRL